MIKWVWHIGLAAMGGIIAACTGGDVAGSSFETENSVALTVHQGNGEPVARAKVLVRPSDFLALANNLSLSEQEGDESPVAVQDSSVGVLNLETDEQGQLAVPRLKPGSYTIEVRDDSAKVMKPITVKDSSFEEITLKVAETGAVTGQVYLPEGYSTVTVGIQGLDYFVQTDSLGNFKFDNIPAGEFTVLGFVFTTYEISGADGNLSTYNSFLPVGSSAVNVVSKDTAKHVTIGQKPTPVPVDTVKKDTVKNDSVAKDTVEPYPVVLFEDFEDSTYGWYTTVSRYAEAKLGTDNGGRDRGLVAHFEYTNDSNYNWVLMGKALRSITDLSKLDSVVFWARAGLSDSTQWISLSFDVQMDSVDLEKYGYENGKAWVHMSLDTVWTRYVVTPASLIIPDTTRNGGNIGWDNVKDHVTNLNFFGGGVGGPFDMWVDDVVIYGVKELE